MYVVQDIFQTKPGKANALIDKFTSAAPHFVAQGIKHQRILVDEVADYWTVIVESAVEDLETYFAFRDNEAAGEALSGYLDFIVSGGRRIYRVAYEA